METVAENPVCAACGADVRDGTQFCYACGKSVTEAPEVAAEIIEPEKAEEAATATEIDAPDAFETSEPAASGSVERKAAQERRAARALKRKPVRMEWQAPSDASGIIFIIVSLAIFVATAILVVYMVVLK